jgi:hypothetical protein
LLKVTQKQFVLIVVENLYIKKMQNVKLIIRDEVNIKFDGGQIAIEEEM